MSGISLVARISITRIKLHPSKHLSKVSSCIFPSVLNSTSTFPRTFLLQQNFRHNSSWNDRDGRNPNWSDNSDDFPVIRHPQRRWSNVDSFPDNDYKPNHRRSGFRSKKTSSYHQRDPRDHDEFSNEEDDYLFSDTFHSRSSRELGARIKKRDWTESDLTAIEKNFYVLHPDVADKSAESTEEFYQKHNITVSRGDRPVPLCDFHEANFPEKVVRYLEQNQWSNPTPIQSIGWPMALSGKNMVGIAQTGSGKTLGFILPSLVHIRHQRPTNRGDGPIVLVLAPTRELAQQIKSVAVEYGRLLGIRSCSIFGGQSKMVQARQLSHGPELVVATPGRLLDFLESEVVNLDRTTYVVLDEADRMLDMGFEPQIRKVLGQIRPDRQMLMWSATWPKEIQQLAHDFLGEFTQVNIGSHELTANPNIQQIVKVCERREKLGLLLHELKQLQSEDGDSRLPKTLIFGQTKLTVDFLTDKLRQRRFRVRAIHGDKSQLQRDTTLQSFRESRTDILVATDVAARGLDVDDIKVVINYDYPNAIDDYIHRIGRTARASKTGTAISFVTEDDAGKLNDLISTLKAAGQEIDPELYDIAQLQAKLSKHKKSFSRSNNRYNSSHRRPNRSSHYNNRYKDWDGW